MKSAFKLFLFLGIMTVLLVLFFVISTSRIQNYEIHLRPAIAESDAWDVDDVCLNVKFHELLGRKTFSSEELLLSSLDSSKGTVFFRNLELTRKGLGRVVLSFNLNRVIGLTNKRAVEGPASSITGALSSVFKKKTYDSLGVIVEHHGELQILSLEDAQTHCLKLSSQALGRLPWVDSELVIQSSSSQVSQLIQSLQRYVEELNLVDTFKILSLHKLADNTLIIDSKVTYPGSGKKMSLVHLKMSEGAPTSLPLLKAVKTLAYLVSHGIQFSSIDLRFEKKIIVNMEISS